MASCKVGPAAKSVRVRVTGRLPYALRYMKHCTDELKPPREPAIRQKCLKRNEMKI